MSNSHYCTYQYYFEYDSEEEKDTILEVLDDVLSIAHFDLDIKSQGKIQAHCTD